MRKAVPSALVVLFALTACGGSRDKPMLVDAGDDMCDPLTQTGCATDHKCAWIVDVAATDDTEEMGHIGCAANGTQRVGETCVLRSRDGADRPVGSSDCEAGSECVAGFCRAICNPVPGTAPECDENHACASYDDLFKVGTERLAGVCDVRCDPLTQRAVAGTARDACGSPDAATPRAGCYGFRHDWTCAPTSLPGLCTDGSGNTDKECKYSYNDDVDGNGKPDRCLAGYTCEYDASRLLTDRKPALTPGPNRAYVNGCAPGFVPFFQEMTGSTVVVCSGLCAPMKTDNTLTANVSGNPTAEAKLPREADPLPGNAVCAPNKKGSAPDGQNCRHMWPYNIDKGVLVDHPYNDNLGICYDHRHYQFDDDANPMTPRVPVPSCTELPPRGTIPNCECNAQGFNCRGTGCPKGQAQDWACYNTADSGIVFSARANDRIAVPPVNPALREFRVGELGDGLGVRHRIVQ